MLQKFKKSLPKAKSSQFVDMKIKTLRFLACFYFMLGKKKSKPKVSKYLYSSGFLFIDEK